MKQILDEIQAIIEALEQNISTATLTQRLKAVHLSIRLREATELTEES